MTTFQIYLNWLQPQPYQNWPGHFVHWNSKIQLPCPINWELAGQRSACETLSAALKFYFNKTFWKITRDGLQGHIKNTIEIRFLPTWNIMNTQILHSQI